jgi:mannose-6-phosphate isomerase
MLYPFIFRPIFKERVWGGRKLEQLYHKALPPAVPIGESWEISDRPGDASVIANGPLAGKDLRWLMENEGEALLGAAPAQNGRFPLLIKILDAREKLSLQVHPPPALAAVLGGEPKTEMWYVAAAEPGAELYAGLKRGVTRAQFERGIQAGTVAEFFHRLSVQAGDAMFLPSGRVHAIGAGLVIFEIQQNSDTTYRVFDWNRLGLDGKPRPLHIRESLASINFGDFEPSPLAWAYQPLGSSEFRPLVNGPLFRVDAFRMRKREQMLFSEAKMRILGLVEGRCTIADPVNSVSVELTSGQFCLIPASVKTEAWLEPGTNFLVAQTA